MPFGQAVPRGRGRDSGSSRRLTIPHRLEACKQLGWKTITAIVLDYSAANDDATAELLAELAEIDENLKRNDLTELQQGIQHAQRKRIYEALHPEAKAGGDHGNQYTGGKQRQTDNLSTCKSYAADAATATGETERTVRRKNLIGEQLESVADQLSGTAIEDNQSELLALAKLQEKKPEAAAVIIEKLVAERDKPAQLGGPEPVAIEEKAAAKEPDKKPKPQPKPNAVSVKAMVAAIKKQERVADIERQAANRISAPHCWRPSGRRRPGAYREPARPLRRSPA